jgi:hypothetical protein
MPEPLKLDKGITYEFEPDSVFEKDGNTYHFMSFKKIQRFKDKGGKEQSKYQNLTVKPEHADRLIEWLQECIDEFKDEGGQGEDSTDNKDVPF